MTTAVELRQQAQVGKVLALVAEGKSITEACELAKVPRSTYYAIMKSGLFDELLAQMKQANITEMITQFTDALPGLYARILADALNVVEVDKDGVKTGLSARDRDQAARTALLFYDKLTAGVSQPAGGESAREWLEKRGKDFQPIQIVDSQVVIVQGKETEVVVDGEVIEQELLGEEG